LRDHPGFEEGFAGQVADEVAGQDEEVAFYAGLDLGEA